MSRILFPLFLLLMVSCYKESQFIETVELTDELYIVESDTVTPVFTIYRADSFQTSSSGCAIIGTVNDPYFGKISGQSYGRFGLATNYYETVGLASESYDSIVLIMHSDQRYYGDTTSIWTASVHQLKQDIDADNTTYYNHHALFSEPQEIGSVSLVFRPNVDDSVRIRLDDDFGNGIFSLYKKKDPYIISEASFWQMYRGFHIKGAESNNVIYSFPSSDSMMYVRLYYHDDQGSPVSKYLDFKSKGGAYQFNNISCDPAGTVLETLVPGGEIPSEQVNHQIYVNDLAGISTKIIFPSVPQLAAVDNFIRIASATLHLKPLQSSFTGYPLIGYMSLGVSNEDAGSVVPLMSRDGEYVQTGDLFVDPLNGMNSGYIYDLTALLRQEISSTVFTTNTLFLQPYNDAGTRSFSMNRIVVADATHTSQRSVLNCQLLFYKQKE